MKAVIGDIHGNLIKLEKLCQKIRDYYDPDIEILCTGDLIDRGPDSKGVIDFCIENKIRSCVGNHDYWLIVVLLGGGLSTSVLDPIWGTKETFKSWGCTYSKPKDIEKYLRDNITEKQKKFICSMNYVLKVEEGSEIYWLTHSGIKSEVGLCASIRGDETDDEIVNNIIEGMPWEIYFSFPKLNDKSIFKFNKGIQVFGHQIVRQVKINNHWIAIDTGCSTCPPYKLSALILPTHEVISV